MNNSIRISIVFLVLASSVNALAFVTCQQEAVRATKAMAKINSQSHANRVTDVIVAEDGTTVTVTLDSRMGGASVTYESTIVSSEPCTISKIELVGEE
ncbi:MAG: hypothetical protein V4736_15100 [Bdellovibrionota bacterium]